MPAKMVKLATGATFAANGFGTWKAEPGQVGASVKAALEVGYRHIDCAAIYTNEAEVGTVFNELFGGDDPTIRREDVWITSKAWNTCGSKKEVVAACRQSLADLQLDYLDEYLVHFPAVWDHEGLPITDATSGLEGADGLAWSKKYTLQNKWEGMEECHRLGLTKVRGMETRLWPPEEERSAIESGACFELLLIDAVALNGYESDSLLLALFDAFDSATDVLRLAWRLSCWHSAPVGRHFVPFSCLAWLLRLHPLLHRPLACQTTRLFSSWTCSPTPRSPPRSIKSRGT